MDYNQIEDLNGIRYSWNVLPTNRIDATSCSLPFGCLYTPLKQIPDNPPNQYDPVVCQRCHCVLNPYCSLDFGCRKSWVCPICKTTNTLPVSYHEMTQDCLAAELHPKYTTIEYIINAPPTFPPIFLFVVDTCLSEKEHQSLKTLLLQAIGTLPPTAMVGFISYGKLVYIHELRFSECPRNFVFNGTKTYEVNRLRQCLSLNTLNSDGINDFIIPISEAEQMLNSIIDTLEIDPFVVEKGNRFERCTGAALDIAVTLIESIFPKSNSQVVLFTGGPITRGPGAMAELKRVDIVRQHRDIDQGKADLTLKSKEFFESVAAKACASNVAVNYISASFEESGVYEISPVIYQTGGFLLSGETFSEENISKTLVKFFKGDVFKNSGADAVISINASPFLKVSGCVGPCASMKTSGPLVSAMNSVGASDTTQWKICGLLPSTTFAFFFEVTQTKADSIPSDAIEYVQFSTKYRHISDGSMRLRITTSALRFADLKTNKNLLIQGFDQEAAAILLAKFSMWKVQKETASDTIAHIDRQIIKFCREFGTYAPKDVNSFQLAPQFQFIPQFIYHFRRSPFLSTFNSTPDQTTTLRYSLLCEDVTNSLFMIQPTLMKYSLDQPPTPVILDMSSLRQDCVLLLDTYFRVLIWHGSTIAAWRDQGYHELEEYQNLKAALDQPKCEAEALIDERFPTPQLASCDQDSSIARYLLSRCNPSNDGTSYLNVYGPGDNLSTDEPSLNNFTQKLKQMAVNS